MSRHLWTTLPVVPSKLCPSLPDFHLVRKKEEQARERHMNNCDTQHRAASLEPLLPGDNVWVTDRRSSGMVVKQSAPRSYQVVMHLSMLCPTTPHTGIDGARWGFVAVMVTNPHPWG